jgi:hypothetical protein
MVKKGLEPILISTQLGYGVSLSIIVLVLSALACALMPKAPVRSKPSPHSPRVAAEILEAPKTACIGEAVTLTLRTVPGNECDAYFSSWIEGKWATEIIISQTADSEGVCLWQWQIPINASPGNAQSQVVVRFGDKESRQLPPQVFPIARCEE